CGGPAHGVTSRPGCRAFVRPCDVVLVCRRLAALARAEPEWDHERDVAMGPGEVAAARRRMECGGGDRVDVSAGGRRGAVHAGVERRPGYGRLPRRHNGKAAVVTVICMPATRPACDGG